MPPQDTKPNKDKDSCFSKLTFDTQELAAAAATYAQWQYGSDKDSVPRPY